MAKDETRLKLLENMVWNDSIFPKIEQGRNVLMVAHGNSLRALIKHLDQTQGTQIVPLNIPTGLPLVYELDKSLRPAKSYYPGDPERVKVAMTAVANQGKIT